jgi:hypothetical protein
VAAFSRGRSRAATLSGVPAILIIAPAHVVVIANPSNSLPPLCIDTLPIWALRHNPIATRAAYIVRGQSFAHDTFEVEAVAVIELDWTVGKGGRSGRTNVRRGTA